MSARLATDAVGCVFVVEYGNHRVQKFGPTPTPTLPASWGRLRSRYR